MHTCVQQPQWEAEHLGKALRILHAAEAHRDDHCTPAQALMLSSGCRCRCVHAELFIAPA
jgi:hypothetical protein